MATVNPLRAVVAPAGLAVTVPLAARRPAEWAVQEVRETTVLEELEALEELLAIPAIQAKSGTALMVLAVAEEGLHQAV